jgi:hypothetical protein
MRRQRSYLGFVTRQTSGTFYFWLVFHGAEFVTIPFALLLYSPSLPGLICSTIGAKVVLTAWRFPLDSARERHRLYFQYVSQCVD